MAERQHGRGILLWLLGIPIPIIILFLLFASWAARMTSPISTNEAAGPHELEPAPMAENTATYPPLIGLVATVAALYFGRDIFMPLATAVLLTFALAPLVSGLRKLHVPRLAAVVAVVV